MCDGSQLKTLYFDDDKNELVIIDQTRLPNEIKYLRLKKQEEIFNAIYFLQVRGAPAIGVAAAYGIYLAAREINFINFDEYFRSFKKAEDYLNSSRPTAVNLSWALKRMEKCLILNKSENAEGILKALKNEADLICKEDIEVCKKIGEYGLKLLKDGDGILTHCNAGSLATVKYGTATAPIYLAHEKGYGIHVFADETRPLLQGARLTAFELNRAGIDVTLICDNMAASIMKSGQIQAVFVGCDRVAANGDAANKIGTSGVAVLAAYYGIPMYICAPTSTIDMNIKTGKEIVVEQRSEKEVTDMWYEKPMAPKGIKVFNPAFDVTENSLITAIITEHGIAMPPYTESLKKIFESKRLKGEDNEG